MCLLPSNLAVTLLLPLTPLSPHISSHPDDLRRPLHNETVDGFFVVLTGRVPGIFFSR